MVIAFAMITIGYATDIPVFQIVGFAFVFLLALPVLAGTLEYKTGKTSSFYYTPGYCADNCTIQATLLSSTEIDSYTAFNDTTSHLFGVYLAAAAVLGFTVAVANLRGTMKP